MALRSSRRGTIYLMVLSTSAVVTTLGLSGLALSRLQRQSELLTRDLMDVRAASLAGFDMAVMAMESDTWRSAAASAAGSLGTFQIGRCQVTLLASDPADHNLTNGTDDIVAVRASATLPAPDGSTGASQSFELRFRPTSSPMDCLSTSLTSGNDLRVNDAALIGTGVAASNSRFDAVGSLVRLGAESVSLMTGGVFYGTQQSLQPPRQLPAPTIFDAYQARGVQIPLSSIPNQRVERNLLSAAVNPYGSVSASGIYWIDCGNNDVTIQQSRLVATLVLMNCRNLILAGAVCLEPSSPGMPCLLVQGKAHISTTLAPLSESSVGVNFNPASTPFGGQSNSSVLDTYPSRCKGLVYVSSDLTLGDGSEVLIDGQLIVQGRFDLRRATLAILYDDKSFYNPPPGFRTTTTMTRIDGTLKQVID